MGGISGTSGVSRPTLAVWLKQEGEKHPDLTQSLLDVPARQDVLEYDELQHFVKKKSKAVAVDGYQPQNQKNTSFLRW
jgi:hypothetical protein